MGRNPEKRVKVDIRDIEKVLKRPLTGIECWKVVVWNNNGQGIKKEQWKKVVAFIYPLLEKIQSKVYIVKKEG